MRARRRFPRLYAAASLKLTHPGADLDRWPEFPRLYAAASLKQFYPSDGGHRRIGFPRLYAAASYKLVPGPDLLSARAVFSAALSRGLIDE